VSDQIARKCVQHTWGQFWNRVWMFDKGANSNERSHIPPHTRKRWASRRSVGLASGKLFPRVCTKFSRLPRGYDISRRGQLATLTATSLWTLYPNILVASERTALRAAISEERLFFSALAAGSSVSGFLLGLKSEPDPNALRARRYLKLALGDYLALGYKEADPEVQTIRSHLATLEQLNPKLQQIKN